jgi:RNA polymerase sigma factor for flagellar operon FliA
MQIVTESRQADEVAPGSLGEGRLAPDAEAALWQRWAQAGDLLAREQLIMAYQPHARMLAAKLYARRSHDEIGFDEYLQFATVAMIESMDRFDHERHVQFSTFASRRIQGAILDGLALLSERNQQMSAMKRWREERVDSLRAAGECNVAVNAGNALFQQLAEVGVGLALGFLLEGTGMIEQADVPEASADAPYQREELRQLSNRMKDMVGQLSDQQRAVVRSHYFQHQRFDTIATHLGVSKARVSQLHQQALRNLRSLISKSRQDHP